MSEAKNESSANGAASSELLGVTREGNEIYPHDAPIRELIKGNSATKCADCIHVADACKGILKGHDFLTYRSVRWCSGFEQVTPNTTNNIPDSA